MDKKLLLRLLKIYRNVSNAFQETIILKHRLLQANHIQVLFNLPLIVTPYFEERLTYNYLATTEMFTFQTKVFGMMETTRELRKYTCCVSVFTSDKTSQARC